MEWNVIRATVHTRDGEAGRVSKVVVDPATGLVTHLVIHEGVLFGRSVLVPTTCVRRVLDGDVWLALDHDALAEQPDFDPEAFEPPPPSLSMPIALPLGGVLWPRPVAPRPPTIPEGVHPGEVALDAGTAVACTDGPWGRVERVLVDEASLRLTGLVIRQGLVFQRLLEAPASWIDHVDSSGVHLKLTRREVAEQASPPGERAP